MKLHDLVPNPGSKKNRTRKGRGIASGSGKTAGRGTKGAGARGGNARKGPSFEGGQLSLMKRLPFKRGFTNLFKIYYQEVNVEDLAALVAAGATVTPAMLEAVGLIRDAEKPVVILGDGELSKSLTIHAHRFSKTAREKIMAAGGAMEVLPLTVTGAYATIKLQPKTPKPSRA